MSALPVITTLKHANQGLVSPLVRLAHHQTDETGNLIATGATNPLPVAGGATPGTAGSTALTTQGTAYTGTFTVTRPANTTAYTAGDVVGGALTIASVGPAGGGDVLMTAVRLMLNITALPSGMTTFKLALYNVTPPSAIADNSPWTLGSGDRASYLGMIRGILSGAIGTGTQSVEAVLELSPAQQFTIPSTGLFAYLVTDGAFTPAANSETYTGTIKALGV